MKINRTGSVMELVKVVKTNDVSQYYWNFKGARVCLSVTSTSSNEFVPPSITDAGVKLELSLDTNEEKNKKNMVALSHEEMVALSHKEAYKFAGQFIVKKKINKKTSVCKCVTCRLKTKGIANQC